MSQLDKLTRDDIAFQLYRLDVVTHWPEDKPERTVTLAAIVSRLQTLQLDNKMKIGY